MMLPCLRSVARRTRSRRFAAVAAFALASPATLLAQTADSARAPATQPAAPRGGFSGRIRNSLDSSGVRTADVRLYYIDSVRVTHPGAPDSLEAFADTARSRIAVTDAN